MTAPVTLGGGGRRSRWAAACTAWTFALLAFYVGRGAPTAVISGTVVRAWPPDSARVLVRGVDGPASGFIKEVAVGEDRRFCLTVPPGRLEAEVRWRGQISPGTAVRLREGERRWLSLAAPKWENWGWLQAGASQQGVLPGERPSFLIDGGSSVDAVRVKVDRFDLPGLVADGRLDAWAASTTGQLDAPTLSRLAPHLSRVREERLPVLAGRWGEHSRYAELSPLPPGAYLVRVSQSGSAAWLTLRVSALAALAKSDGHRVLVYACHLRTGEPWPGASVRLIRSGGGASTDTSAVTDASGLAWLDLPRRRSQLVSLLISSGPHAALVEGWAYRADEASLTCHLYTDRPIYRPGQTVYLKGIVRRPSDTGYTIPERQRVRLEVRDGRGQMVAKLGTTTSEWGSFDTQWTVDEDAFTGEWQVTAAIGEHTEAWHSVRVEAYRKPVYKVVASTPGRLRRPQDRLRVQVAATYYFGSPVGGAQVQWSLRRVGYVWSEWEDAGEEWSSAGEEVAHGTGRLDAAGRLALDLPLAPYLPIRRALPGFRPNGQPIMPDATRPVRIALEVTVADGTGRQERASAVVPCATSEVRLQTEFDRSWLGWQQATKLRLKATALDGRPLVGRTVTVVPYRSRSFDDAIVGPYGTPGWDQWLVPVVPDDDYLGLPRRSPIDWPRRWREVVSRYAPLTAITDAAGLAVLHVHPPRPGSWRYVAYLPDAAGRLAVDTAECHVTSADGRVAYWRDSDSLTLERLGDGPLRPGDSAHLRLQHKLDGPVLVTEEGDRLGAARLVRVARGAAATEVRVTESDVPNAVVGAVRVHDKQMDQASVDLPVDPRVKQLEVAVSANVTEARPGQPVRFTVRCRRLGRPVQAELSLAVVDESIFAMCRDRPEEAARAFWSERYNRVNTWFSATPGYYAAGKDEVGEVRRDFPDTALWKPALVTGADGTATVELRLPGNLGQWRATAIAHSRDTAIGFGRCTIQAAKPLMVRLEAPRFLVRGDQPTLTAAVHNDSGATLPVTVRLETQGLRLAGAAEQRRTVPSGGRANLVWRATCLAADSARVRAMASAGALSDAEERTLPVRPLATTTFVHRTGTLRAGQPRRETLHLPPRALREQARLRVTCTATPVDKLLAAVDGLIVYPYGCVEQTSSKLLGCLAARRVWQAAGWPSDQPGLSRALDGLIRRGILRLRRLQNGAGGWGWFDSGNTSIEMSAIALHALTSARTAGFEVPPSLMDSGLDTLAAKLGHPSGSSTAAERAMAVWILARAGRSPKPSHFDALLADPSLGPEAAALLALAARAAKRDELVPRADAACAAALANPSTAGVPGLAYGLRARLAAEGDTPRVRRLLSELAARFDGRMWTSTRDTATAVAALGEALEALRLTGTEGTASYALNGSALKTQPIAGRGTGARWTEQGAAKLLAANRLELGFEGRGEPQWALLLSVPVEVDRLPALASSAGLRASRRYDRVVRGLGGRFRYQDVRDEPVRRGDVLRVTLHLRSQRAERYVLVEDALPAGCEVIDPSSVTGRDGHDPFWVGGWVETDIRDDRVAFFLDQMSAGQTVRLTYLLRAAHPGRYTVLPARVEPMYEPTLFARTADAELEIR